MDPVSANHQVVGIDRAVTEFYPDALITILGKRRNPGSETAGSLCCTRQQDIVQLGALDRHVRADIAPELFKIDLAEHVALLIAEQPSAHKPTRFFDSFAKA